MKSKLLYGGIGLMVIGILCIFYLSSRVTGPLGMATILVGAVCFLVGFVRFRHEAERHVEFVRRERRDQMVRQAFADMDILRANKRWLGAESEMVKKISVAWLDKTTVQYRYLCHTKRGAWFVYELAVDAFGARVYHEGLDPADSEFAQDALLDDRELFAKFFNVPDIDIA